MSLVDPAPRWEGLDGLLAVRARLHAWAEADPRIRAAVAFGSTERTDRAADAWSDIDLLFVVDDAKAWLDDLDWVGEIGPSWLRLVETAPIPEIFVVQVLFAGGYDADLIPIDREHLGALLMPDVAAEFFGHGARVLFDHIGALGAFTIAGGDAPRAAGTGIQPPSGGEFARTVTTFLYQTVWATKRLLRGERWRAHDDVDDYMRDRMLTMIEWQALARGYDGIFPEARRLEAWVPQDVADALPDTFAQYDDASIAQSLVGGHALFRRMALEVADYWGLSYPDAADAEIERWVSQRLAERGFVAGTQ